MGSLVGDTLSCVVCSAISNVSVAPLELVVVLAGGGYLVGDSLCDCLTKLLKLDGLSLLEFLLSLRDHGRMQCFTQTTTPWRFSRGLPLCCLLWALT